MNDNCENSEKYSKAPAAGSPKHTPGPWHADGWLIEDESHNPLTIATSAIRGETGKANARLIAAAPALADALESALNYHRCTVGPECMYCPPWVAALRAAGRLP